MAHTFLDNVAADIENADEVFTAPLLTLNNSGVSGTAFITRSGNELTVSVAAQGLTPNQAHIQHIHGAFDGMDAPANSQVPGVNDDTDQDGYVEVLEGVPKYGDILLPLVDDDGNSPVADENGVIYFSNTYDLTDDSKFFSPVTGEDYTGEDLFPLSLREVVLHGVDVPAGPGQGTMGEVDGSGGYKAVLPAATNEIAASSATAALDLVESTREAFGVTVFGTIGDDVLEGLSGNDVIIGRAGDDDLMGLGGNDFITGNAGSDTIAGNDGDDTILGRADDDQLSGGMGDDAISGDQGADTIDGGSGDDTINGGSGDDAIVAGEGDDRVVAAGGDDMVDGGEGDDSLYGREGADYLFGDAGNDVIISGSGDDTLEGGADNDIYIGGAGRDVFVITGEGGYDGIHDFQAGTDLIGLADGVEFEDLSFTGRNIWLDDEMIARTVGVVSSTLTEDDFTTMF